MTRARRSVLFTPGDRPSMLRKAPEAGSDTVVFDLEDAVAPGEKSEARTAVREVLASPQFSTDAEVCVRVNADEERAIADLDTLLGTADGGRDREGDEPVTAADRLDSLMVPKVTDRTDVDRLAAFAADRGASVPVLALIESARGVLAAPDVARADATDALIFGAEDYAADVGATRTATGTEVLYARQRVVTAAAAAGCDAIDTVFTDFGDEAGLREATAEAVEFGYDGKLAIHPAQVDPINDAFTPAGADVEWARAVLEAKREADNEGRGVFEVDGEMIDAPLIAQAERIRQRANAAGIDR